MPEPSSKLYFTDPRATPETDSVSVSSLGSKLEQAMASGLRLSRKYEHLVSLHHLAGDELVTESDSRKKKKPFFRNFRTLLSQLWNLRPQEKHNKLLSRKRY